MYAILATGFAAYITTEVSNRLRAIGELGPDATRPYWFKFIDLISVSLGYLVGWAWSDAAVCVLMESLAFTDMKALYLVYSIVVTIAAACFTMHMASVLDDPAVPVLQRQYLTLFLNALALMTGWAWKSYIQNFVNQMPPGEGRIVSNYLQALTQTLLACYVYHQICVASKNAELAASEEGSAAEDRVVQTAGGQMD